MKLCTKCVMPETAETLSYEGSGVCSVCKQVEFKDENVDWMARAKDLDALIEAHRGKYDYDCIVPFSGGKDSTYTLWYLVKEKGLKPLVVRFDHGFMRSTLIENNTRTFRTLGVDVITFTPNWQVVKKLMFESLRRRGDFCWHCHTGIFAYPMWVALEKKVPLIFWGEPSAEYASFYTYQDEEEFDEERFNLIVNLGINAEDMVGMIDDSVSGYKVTERDLKPYTYPKAADLAALGVRSVPLGSFIPWDVRRQVQIIKDELGWRGDEVEGVPPQWDYEKIECFMQGVRDYVKFLKRGFGRTAHLTSIDVRNNRMSRDEAMQLTAEFDGKRPAALDIFLDYLGIGEDEFMDIVKPHVVAPHVMPNLGDMQANRTNRVPHDFDKWTRVTGEREHDAELD
jgi:N-acetyl sugar amidotransferase